MPKLLRLTNRSQTIYDIRKYFNRINLRRHGKIAGHHLGAFVVLLGGYRCCTGTMIVRKGRRELFGPVNVFIGF